jgi:SHS2 domain-containing protein
MHLDTIRIGGRPQPSYLYLHVREPEPRYTSTECIDGAVVNESRWEHFAHDADIGIRGCGQSRAAAFEQAALAMTAVIADPASIEPRDAVDLHAAAPDDELLLADWLNALVYEMATRRMLFSRFEVEIDGGRLQGRAWGERMDIVKHSPIVEVKGATYTSLRVAREPDGTWIAQCVIDV